MAEKLPGESGAGAADERAFRVMVEAYLDGGLSASGLAELEAKLAAEPAFRRVFVEVCQQDQAIFRMVSPDAGELGLFAGGACEPSGDELSPADDADAGVMASLVDDALRARRLHELESEAAAALAQSREHSERWSRRRAAAMESGRHADRRGLPTWGVWGALAAALLLAAWLGSYWGGGDGASAPPPVVEGDEQLPRFAGHPAYISGGAGAQWDGPNASRRLLSTGMQMSLREGLAEVVFADGARVIVEGPAVFEPTGSSGVRLLSGRVVASSVSGGSGFRVSTPTLEVTDLGGEFGVSVSRSGQSRADVIAGQVAVVAVGSAARNQDRAVTLSAGTGAMASSRGVSLVEADLSGLVVGAEFDARVTAASGSAYGRWLAHSYTLRRDRDVVAYFVFDASDQEEGRLRNRSMLTSDAAHGQLGNGAEIAAPRWTTGRFEQTRALRFGDAGSGRTYGVVVPDDEALDLNGPMTIALWVRAATPNDLYGTLLSKREVPPRRMNYQASIMGSWQGGGDELQFGAGLDDASLRGFTYSQRSGRLSGERWLHIVFTVDGRDVAFFVNGQRVQTERQDRSALTNDAPLLIGTSAVGGGQSFFDRAIPFQGEISEVLIARRAFSDAEVRTLYRNSRND